MSARDLGHDSMPFPSRLAPLPRALEPKQGQPARSSPGPRVRLSQSLLDGTGYRIVWDFLRRYHDASGDREDHKVIDLILDPERETVEKNWAVLSSWQGQPYGGELPFTRGEQRSASTILFAPVVDLDRLVKRFPWAAGVHEPKEVLHVLLCHELAHLTLQHSGLRTSLDHQGSQEELNAKFRAMEAAADVLAERWFRTGFPPAIFWGGVEKEPSGFLRRRAIVFFGRERHGYLGDDEETVRVRVSAAVDPKVLYRLTGRPLQRNAQGRLSAGPQPEKPATPRLKHPQTTADERRDWKKWERHLELHTPDLEWWFRFGEMTAEEQLAEAWSRVRTAQRALSRASNREEVKALCEEIKKWAGHHTHYQLKELSAQYEEAYCRAVAGESPRASQKSTALA